MADETAESPQRWTGKRRMALVVSLLKGETTAAAAARTHELTVAEIEEWRERFLLGAENALRARPKDGEALKDEHIKKLKLKINELVLDLDILIGASLWLMGRALVTPKRDMSLIPSRCSSGSIATWKGSLEGSARPRTPPSAADSST